MTAPRLAVDPSDRTPRVDGAPTPAPDPDSRIPPPKAVERDGGGARRKRRPKDIGTADETAVVRALRRLGFPGAERRALRGRKDVGDILVCPGIIGEVKGGAAGRRASDYQIFAWLTETEGERVNAGAAIGILIIPRNGIGRANAERWWAIIWTSTLLELHRQDWMPELAPWYDAPIRMRLVDLAHIMRAAGYGDLPDETP